MDIHETYVRFQNEQHDAINPEQRTRFDAFGEVRPEPTIEGFDQWGKAPTFDRKLAQAKVRREDVEHEHAKLVLADRLAEDRRRVNRLIAARRAK